MAGHSHGRSSPGVGRRDPTRRFSGCVDAYARFRPSYPPGLVPLLERERALIPGAMVADVGSGTGLLARRFLERGYAVLGVEPNRAMREVGERELADWPGFRSVAGRAEHTTLPAGSVDLVAVGQAFHWFDPAATREEFRRILRAAGKVALVWNNRRLDASGFMEDYEDLLGRHGTDYHEADHQRLSPETISAFFGGSPPRRRCLLHRQSLDAAGLEGRFLSASYVPAVGEPGHDRMMDDLRGVFERHAARGRVEFLYEMVVHFGSL